jgi:hypothetical protein
LARGADEKRLTIEDSTGRAFVELDLAADPRLRFELRQPDGAAVIPDDTGGRRSVP